MKTPDRWNLLRVAPCRACGRPAAEGAPCAWCGERAPLCAATAADIRFALAGILLCLASIAFADLPWGPKDRPMAALLSALSGAAIALPATGRGHCAIPITALAAGLLALASRFVAPAWRETAADFSVAAWTVPLSVLVVLLLFPAPLPPIPAETRYGRFAQRFLPVLAVAGWPLGLCAAALAAAGCANPFAVLGLAVVLWRLGERLRKPAALAVPAAFALQILCPDPAAFALGLVAAAAAGGKNN